MPIQLNLKDLYFIATPFVAVVTNNSKEEVN